MGTSPLPPSPKWAQYHAYTLWLFTYNDLKTMVYPSTIFAFFHLLPFYAVRSQAVDVFFSRLPSILVYIWFNLLAFVVNNQRPTASVEEDRLNKPWRPIPAGRLTQTQARTLGLISYPLALLVSMLLSAGVNQSALLALCGYIYNNHGGGDSNFWVRNLLNACGFTSFASGALEVALGSSIPLSIIPWLLIIAAVVFTTVHTQDMYDQVGDSAAGRQTVPLVIGDGPARWSIAISVMLWSLVCPLCWASGSVGYIAPILFGGWVTLRSLTRRTVKEDRTTFRIYNAWLVSIYSLPACYTFGFGY